MKTTVYITRTSDMIRFGQPAAVTMEEPPETSRTWIRKVVVEIPPEFHVGKNGYGEPAIFGKGEKISFDMIANSNEDPCIIDHTENGKYIPLTVVSEGWDA